MALGTTFLLRFVSANIWSSSPNPMFSKYLCPIHILTRIFSISVPQVNCNFFGDSWFAEAPPIARISRFIAICDIRWNVSSMINHHQKTKKAIKSCWVIVSDPSWRDLQLLHLNIALYVVQFRDIQFSSTNFLMWYPRPSNAPPGSERIVSNAKCNKRKVGLRQRTSSKSCFGWDIEFLKSGTRKILLRTYCGMTRMSTALGDLQPDNGGLYDRSAQKRAKSGLVDIYIYTMD